jgi:hypothetical protein
MPLTEGQVTRFKQLQTTDDTDSTNSFRIQYKGQTAILKLNPGAVGTYVW